MKARTLVTGIILALAGWFALAPTSALKAASLRGYQVAENEQHHERRQIQERRQKGTQKQRQERQRRGVRNDEWYQGQRGHWYKEGNRWQWRGAEKGDQWYQGHRGHWYNNGQPNGWQFQSSNLVCDNNGLNCRRGRYLPPNGQGMVNPKNPRLYWGCDSEGHHCTWKPRPRAQSYQWYQGQRGRWQKQGNAWRFRSEDLVCDNNGLNCLRGRYLPPNGQGMVNPKNPRLYWGCDSEGHHCAWKRRPGY